MPKSFDDFIADPEPKDTVDSDGKKKKAPEYVLEGDLDVMPDCQYKSGETYSLRGLGAVFNGDYRVRRVTHTIDSSGYSVTLTMTKGVGSKSARKDGGDKSTASEARRTQAETQKPKSEAAGNSIVVNKEDGSWYEK